MRKRKCSGHFLNIHKIHTTATRLRGRAFISRDLRHKYVILKLRLLLQLILQYRQVMSNKNTPSQRHRELTDVATLGHRSSTVLNHVVPQQESLINPAM